MIKFYTNQELARKFGINLARWKRWSREFLPPDPLGGLQSGYARQYSSDQAFTVFLGGYLVGDLKFTIPEARLILDDLHQWLVDHKFYFNYTGNRPAASENSCNIQYYHVAICRQGPNGSGESAFSYFIKGVIADSLPDTDGLPGLQERFIESPVPTVKTAGQINQAASYRVLNINILKNRFLKSLDGVRPVR